MFITVNALKEMEACLYQVAAFRAEWPDGVEINEEAVLRAFEIGLDVDWFAGAFLKRWQYEYYVDAVYPQQRALRNAHQKYLKIRDAADEQSYRELNEVSVWRHTNAYWDALDLHQTAYLWAVIPYQKACEQAKATALVAATEKERE